MFFYPNFTKVDGVKKKHFFYPKKIFFTQSYYFLANLDCWLYLKLVSTIFYRIFLFYQIIALQKLWKMFLISYKKHFSFSRYSNFCNFLPSIFHTLQIQKDKWKWNNLSLIGLHKLADVIFRITQKLLYIISSNLVI